jgi:tetratricopeptide (TPR) repeat protein
MAATPALVRALTTVATQDTYTRGGETDHAALAATIREITRDVSAEDLYEAAAHFRDRPDIATPLLEDVVRAQPNNARALVRLANCYWLLGAGPQPVAELASRAIAADPHDRAAWHLWALADEQARGRVGRWQQVVTRFPEDDLALANVADNAASVAGAEHDYEMVDVAIAAYETLRSRAKREEERVAVDRALETLRAWKF